MSSSTTSQPSLKSDDGKCAVVSSAGENRSTRAELNLSLDPRHEVDGVTGVTGVPVSLSTWSDLLLFLEERGARLLGICMFCNRTSNSSAEQEPATNSGNSDRKLRKLKTSTRTLAWTS